MKNLNRYASDVVQIILRKRKNESAVKMLISHLVRRAEETRDNLKYDYFSSTKGRVYAFIKK